MRFNLLFIGLICLSVFCSCQKKESSLEPNILIGPDTTNIEDVNVPDGFDYSSSQEVAFHLTTVNNINEVVEKVPVKIMGIDQNDQADSFYSGITNEQGVLSINLAVSNHLKSLQIVTNYQGVEKVNPIAITETINEELTVD